MTEREWLECGDPQEMLSHLFPQTRSVQEFEGSTLAGYPVMRTRLPSLSDVPLNKENRRKLQLFAIACCWEANRRNPLKQDNLAAVQLAEHLIDRYQDQPSSLGETTRFDSARHRANDARRGINSQENREGWQAAWLTCMLLLPSRRLLTAWEVASPEWGCISQGGKCFILRCIFGDPFRPWCTEGDREWADKDSVEADEWLTRTCGDHVMRRSWLTWNNGTVHQVAESIYQDRVFENMPILADALEQAGCADESILKHCRGSGSHFRGCWVLDLLLGKA